MADTLILPPPESTRANAVAELLSLALGAGFTLVLFLAVAHFGVGDGPAEEPEMTDLRAISVPLEPPPPRPVEEQETAAVASPFSGLEIAAVESPMKIAVVPPDLATLLPANTTAPSAKIDPARLYTEFKPKTDIGGDFSRIFQQHEVDQRAAIVSQPTPHIPPVVRAGAEVLRVNVLMLINARGTVDSVRLLESSGNKHFDAIILRDIRETWIFSPAMKKGHKVRCLVQRTIRFEWKGGSPFDP
jgi:TonB family protein